MMIKTLKYNFLLLMCVAILQTKAQSPLDAVTKPITEYSNTNVQEKIFMHTDKSFYLAGEIIWFKLYVTDAQRNKPLDMSKVGYVEILNKEHKPVIQAKIALNGGNGNGSFLLPYSVNTGVYTLRAYTNWMKNGSADYFFEKDITIVNALKNPEWPVETNESYDVQFFPEGGDMLNGINSKIAFKITDSHGIGVTANGAILNMRNDTVVRFSSMKFGMGHFAITPDADEKYRAVVRMPDGKIINKELPAIRTSGIVMKVTDNKNTIIVSIDGKNAGATVSLLVHARGSNSFAVGRQLFGDHAEVEIDKSQLNDGISHFIVFNQDNQPVCERLYFKAPSSLAVTAATDDKQYGSRKKVTVNLATANEKQSAVSGDLSMSVFLLDSLQHFESSDILSYLWLQSDLKGNVESPSYYFNKTDEAAAAADNLMLTQGWRRFTWNNVVKKESMAIEYLPELEGHIINGKLLNKFNNQSAENISAYVSVPAEKPLFTGATSGRNGNIRFNVKNFYGGNEIIVQTNPGKDSLYRIDISSPFSEKYSDRKLSALYLPESQSSSLLNHSLGTQTGNAFYSDKQQHFLFPKAIDTTPFYGMPDRRYYLDDYTRFQTMEEVMREYVQDVHVHKNNNHFTYRVRNKSFDEFFETDPMVMIDGVPVFDVDKIVAFDPLKIKRVDVVAQRFYQQGLVHDGIISYSTYQADLGGYALDANALIVEYEGMQLQREFYSPVYTANTSTRLPDFRNVLFWSPEIKTDKNGKQQVSFYTADIPGTYGIVLQGITHDGLAGSTTTTFSVK